MGGCTLLSSSPLSQGKDEGGCAHPLFLFLVRPLLCPLSIHGCPFPVFLLLRSQVPHLRTPFGLSRQLPDKPESRQIDKPESWQPHHLPRTCHHLILRAPARRAHLLPPQPDSTLQSLHNAVTALCNRPPVSSPSPRHPLQHRFTAALAPPAPLRPIPPTFRQIDKPTSWQVGKRPRLARLTPPPCSPSSCSRARLLIHPALAPLPAARRVLLPRGKPRNRRALLNLRPVPPTSQQIDKSESRKADKLASTPPPIAAKRPNPIPLSYPPCKPKTLLLLLFLLPAPPPHHTPAALAR